MSTAISILGGVGLFLLGMTVMTGGPTTPRPFGPKLAAQTNPGPPSIR